MTERETGQDGREDRGRPGGMWALQGEQLDFKSKLCHLLAGMVPEPS